MPAPSNYELKRGEAGNRSPGRPERWQSRKQVGCHASVKVDGSGSWIRGSMYGEDCGLSLAIGLDLVSLLGEARASMRVRSKGNEAVPFAPECREPDRRGSLRGAGALPGQPLGAEPWRRASEEPRPRWGQHRSERGSATPADSALSCRIRAVLSHVAESGILSGLWARFDAGADHGHQRDLQMWEVLCRVR